MDESAPRGRARFPSLLRLVIPLVLLAAGAWLVIRPVERKISPPGPPDIVGRWIGGYELDDGWKYVEVAFHRGINPVSGRSDATFGTMDQPLALTRGDLLWRGRLDSSHVHFESITSSDPLVFDGEVKDDTILGEVRQADAHGTFHLLKLRGADRSFEDYVGMYQVRTGGLISIRQTGLFDRPTASPQLVYEDFSSARIGRLFPVGKDTYALGPGMLVPLPLEVQVRFVRNAAGAVAGLRRRERSGAEAPATRLTFQEEAVRFQNGDVNLYGTLTLPNTPGPHPAVVFVLPRGATRSALGEYPHLFAHRGIAVLAYDTRGMTTMTNEWVSAKPEVLAQDALAGVRFLESRRDISPREVGLLGIHGGGVLALVAAAQAPDVAFIALLASPAVPLWEGERDRIEHELQADGFSAGDIAQALSLNRQQEAAQRAGREAILRLQDAYDRAREQKWWPYFSSAWNFFGRENYDPVTALERVGAPVLAVFGELDQLVPAQKNRERLEAGLQRAGNTDYTIVIVPRANHDFLLAETGGRKEWPRLSRIAPGYLDTIMDWILARAGTPR